MKTFYSINNQTMIDLCLQAYGTTDLLVKFCTDNNITNINYVPLTPQQFVYDDTLVTDQRVTTYVFVTGTAAAATGTSFIPEGGDGYFETEDGESIYSTE